MIVISVEDYCQQCLDFCPDMVKAERLRAPNGEVYFSDTIIQCKYRKRCAGIRRYLEQQMKGEPNERKA